MKNRYIYLLSLGHLLNDLNQGVLPALLPFLILKLNLSYAQAAGLVFATCAISSVAQPILGHISDKLAKPWMMPIGIFLGGLGISFVGYLNNYTLIFLVVAFSGLGVAAFHPEAVRFANFVSGENKATGISIFAIGGNGGFALGPVVATALLLKFGLKATAFLAVPTTLMALVMVSQLNKLSKYQEEEMKLLSADNDNGQQDEWGSFTRLSMVVISRSIIFSSLNTFIPLYWIAVLGLSNAAGSTALSILMGVGIVGNIIGGRLSDKYGNGRVIRVSFLALIPAMLLFITTKSYLIATIMLIPMGFTIFSVYSPMVLMAQKYLPKRIGLASGVTMGLSVSVGGIVVPLIGRMADMYGLQPALYLVAGLPIIASIMSFSLSEPKSEVGDKKQLAMG